MQVADAFVRLVLDERELEKGIGAQSGPAAAAAGRSGTTVGQRFSSAFGKASTAVGVGAGALIAGGIESATAFEDQLRTINTVAGLTDAELSGIGDQIQGLSRETGKTTDDLAAGFYDLVSAGVPAGEAIGVLRDSAILATGALGTTAESVDLVSSVMNAYGLKAADSAKITDVFAKAVADGKVTAAELGASIANIAPIAASAGVSMEEVSAGFALLTAKGVPAAQAATQMRAAVSALLTPNEKLNEIQKETGLNFAQIAEEKGLAVALEELRKSTGGSAEEMGKALGSIEAYQFALATTGENAGAMAEQIAETGDATGLAAEQYAEKSKSVEEQGKRLVATFATFVQDVGAPFIGTLGSSVFALNQLGQAFGIPISPAKLLGGAIGGIGGKLIPLLLSSLAGVIPAITGAVTGIGGAIAALIPIGMAALPFILVGALIAAIVAFIAIPEFRNKVLEIGGAIVGFIGQALQGIGAVLGQILTAIGQVVGQVIAALLSIPGAAIGWVAGILGQVGQIVGGALEAFGRFVGGIVAAVLSIPGAIASWVGSILGQAGQIASGVIAKAGELAGGVVSFILSIPGHIAGLVGSILGIFANAGSAAIGAIVNAIGQIISTILGLPGRVVGGLVGGIGDVAAQAAAAFLGPIKGAVDAAIGLISGIADFAGDVASNVGGFLGGLVPSFAVGTMYAPEGLAYLHAGEIVVPPDESEAIRRGQAFLGDFDPDDRGGSGGPPINVNVYNPAPEPASTSTKRELRKLAVTGRIR